MNNLNPLQLKSIIGKVLKTNSKNNYAKLCKLSNSALNYIILNSINKDQYIIAGSYKKTLKVRFMIASVNNSEHYHITHFLSEKSNILKIFNLAKFNIVIPKAKFIANNSPPYLQTEDLNVFIAIYKATRVPKQTDEEIDNYLLDVYNNNNTVYHQGNKESNISDYSFDQLRVYLIDKGLVKKEETGATPVSKKVSLKTPLGSLENAFDVPQTEKFFSKYSKNIILVATPKIDGISGQINYVNGRFVSGNTKGDGYIGEDITNWLKLMPAVPKTLSKSQTIQIRCEIYMKNSVFYRKYSKESGIAKPFANPRNLVAGLKNRKIPDSKTSKDVSILGYSIIGSNKNKSEQLKEIAILGFPVVSYKTLTMADLSKASNILSSNRKSSDFEQDGLVLDIDESKHRNSYIGSGINPRYAVAFKEGTQEEKTTIRDCIWTISKDGLFKPTIIVDPVIVEGAKVSKISVHNANKVKTQGLGPGAIILVIRSGSAIPHVKKVIKPAKPKYPSGSNWSWSANGIEIVLNKGEISESQDIEQIKTFFSILGVERFSEGLIEAFYKAGFKTIPEILHITKPDILLKVPRQGQTSAQNIINEFYKLQNPGVDLPSLLAASGCFGRGLGKLKFKQLYAEYGDDLINGWKGSTIGDIATSIANVHGFSFDTGKQFALGINNYLEFYKKIADVVSIKKITSKTGILNGQVIAFSEFRDKALVLIIEDLGGSYTDSLSSKTTLLLVPRDNTVSTKTKKAKEKSIAIMSIEKFKIKYKL